MPSPKDGKEGTLVAPGPPNAANPADDGKPGSVEHQATPTPSAAPPPKTGLGAKVDAIAAKSPTLTKNVNTLQQNGWTIKYGTAGKGSYTDRPSKTIVVDSNEQSDPNAVTQTLAHESGHAGYTPDAYVPPTGLTKDQYVAANVNSSLKDEGEATMTNAQVRKEIVGNGGPDIGIAGAQSQKYNDIYNQNSDPAQRDAARQAIGNVFADGEHPSTAPSSTYRDYYAKTYQDYYDKTLPGSGKP